MVKSCSFRSVFDHAVGAVFVMASMLSACSEPIVIEINIVEPCNQKPLMQIDYLRFIPKGQDIDSDDLTSVYPVAKPFATPIPMPLAPDFQLLVTGHRETYSNPTAGIGISETTDLLDSAGSVSITVPFALIDEFYKTTDLANPEKCTELNHPRMGATATFLPQENKVLIVGGMALGQAAPRYRRAIEMFDPRTGTFTEVGELKLELARAYHTASLLPDGGVLIAGGISEQNVSTASLRTAFIISQRDSSDRVKVSNTINMRKPRSGHRAVTIAGGRIVFIGGRQLSEAAALAEDHTYLADLEIFDPKDKQFISPADPLTGNLVEMSTARYGHSAVVLATGNEIMIAGGFNKFGPQASIDIVHVSGTEITVTATATTKFSPIFHAATLVADGTVLFSGGYEEILDADAQGRADVTSVGRTTKNVAMWSYQEEFSGGPKHLTLLCVDEMTRERGHHTASIAGRRAVFIGGHDLIGVSSDTAEIVYLGGDQGGKCFVQAPKIMTMTDDRARHTVTALPSGEFLILGGLTQDAAVSQSITSAEILSPARSTTGF